MTSSDTRPALMWLTYLSIVGFGLFLGLIAYRRSAQPYLGVGLAVLTLVLLLWVKLPRVALGLTTLLTLIGDTRTVSWFPFTKNFSSRESIMFISDAVSISPFELSLGVGLVVVVWRNLEVGGKMFEPAPLTRPMLIFLAFCLFGFVSGMAKGGDLRIALFEIRPLLYLPVLYLIFVNVCSTRRDYRRLVGVAVAAIIVQSLLSLNHLRRLDRLERGEVDSLIEHGSAIGMNLLALLFVLCVITPRIPRWIPWALAVALIPVGWVYVVSQRRAAIVALGGAMVLVALHLWWRQRARFWKVVPLVGVLCLGYVAAFWNVESSAGFPAQAVKTVVAPDQVNEADASSNVYRDIEKFDLWATIRADPIEGQGFGRPFLRPIPLPDISVFEFNEYIPHNSLLWVWIKTGFGGFVTLLYLIARAMTLGTERYRRMPSGPDQVVALAMLGFVTMFSIFLFVDIAWEARNVLLLAMAFALSTGTFVGAPPPTRPVDPPPDDAERKDGVVRVVDFDAERRRVQRSAS